MEALQTLIPLLISLSLAGLVLAVGLNSAKQDLLFVLTRPALLGRAVAAVVVAPVVVAVAVVSFLPVETPVKAAILLMAVSPVPPLVPGKQLAMGGTKNYAYGLYFAMAVLTIFSVPLAMWVVTSLYGRNDTASIGAIARTVGLTVLLPLAIGLTIRGISVRFAEAAWKRVYQASMILVLIAFVPVLVKVGPALLDLLGNGSLIAMTLMTVATLLIGHALGGPGIHNRATLAITAAVRHPGIAVSLAAGNFHNPQVSAAILLYLLVGLVASAPYTAWIKRHSPPSSRPPSNAAHA